MYVGPSLYRGWISGVCKPLNWQNRAFEIDERNDLRYGANGQLQITLSCLLLVKKRQNVQSS